VAGRQHEPIAIRPVRIVRVVVQVPPKTTKRMEELLAEYQKLEDEQMKASKKGFWDKLFG